MKDKSNNDSKDERHEWLMRQNYHNKAYIYIQMQMCKTSLADWLKQQLHSPRDQKKDHLFFKPGKILLTKSDILKLCDLGLATELDEESTRSNCGTPLYKAPEQVGFYYTSKVGIFSLGLILTELVIMDNDRRKKIFSNIRRRKYDFSLFEQQYT
ncbi:hypothetical protein PMAYCL1PPCAC_08449, partial [Pristionchus mayeri]